MSYRRKRGRKNKVQPTRRSCLVLSPIAFTSARRIGGAAAFDFDASNFGQPQTIQVGDSRTLDQIERVPPLSKQQTTSFETTSHPPHSLFVQHHDKNNHHETQRSLLRPQTLFQSHLIARLVVNKHFESNFQFRPLCKIRAILQSRTRCRAHSQSWTTP